MEINVLYSSLMSQDLERVMRRIEINRTWEKDWLETDYSKMAEISMRFMDASIDLKDARYLNTALKINDRLKSERFNNVDLELLEHKEDSAITQLRISLGLDT